MGKLNITELELSGVKIIEPLFFEDNRGDSGETFNIRDLQDNGIEFNFVLDYQAMNLKANTIRGIHFQNNPKPQTKLVRVLSGSIIDFVVDLRKDSPTFKKWVSHNISAENKKQILIPNGFGHGFITTEDNTVVMYKFDDYYDGTLVRTIKWDDEEIGIAWGTNNPILSSGDANACSLKDSDVNFNVGENK